MTKGTNERVAELLVKAGILDQHLDFTAAFNPDASDGVSQAARIKLEGYAEMRLTRASGARRFQAESIREMARFFSEEKIGLIIDAIDKTIANERVR